MNFAVNVPQLPPSEVPFQAQAVVALVGSRVICDVSPQRCAPKFASKSPVSVDELVNGTRSVGSVPALSVDFRPATTSLMKAVGLLEVQVMNMRPSPPA